MIQLKNTKINVIHSDNKKIVSSHHVMARSKNINEHHLRSMIAQYLHKAHRAQKKEIILGFYLESLMDFSLVAAAKITAQEIFKFLRADKVYAQDIKVVSMDKELYQIFHKQVEGYINHMQHKLGKGPYVTVDLIIEFKNGIILIKRSNPPFGWALPGGFVDYGESLEHAARREAKEETALDLVNLRQFHTYSDPKRDPRFQTISTVFTAQGKGKPQSGDDAQDLIVADFKDLMKRQYPFDHKKIIKEYLEYRK